MKPFTRRPAAERARAARRGGEREAFGQLGREYLVERVADRARVCETQLDLLWMDVEVDQLWRQIEVHDPARIPAPLEHAAVRLSHGDGE